MPLTREQLQLRCAKSYEDRDVAGIGVLRFAKWKAAEGQLWADFHLNRVEVSGDSWSVVHLHAYAACLSVMEGERRMFFDVEKIPVDPVKAVEYILQCCKDVVQCFSEPELKLIYNDHVAIVNGLTVTAKNSETTQENSSGTE